MTGHLDDMRHFMLLTEAATAQPIEHDVVELEETLEDQGPSLLEDIHAVLFKLQSHRIDETSEEFAEGLEEGIMLASNMLHRLLERHGKAER